MESNMAHLGNNHPDDDSPVTLGPPRPNALQQREQLVEQGDFAAIYQQILQTPWPETKHSDAFAQVFRAIDVASRNDPSRLSAEFFRMMLNMAGYLTLRVQYTLLERIQGTDRHNYNRPPDIPADVLETFEGHFSSMQSHLAELCQSQAATARLWQLARQKELENKHRAVKRRRKRRLPGKATGATPGGPANGVQGPEKGNGHGSNRMASLLGNGDQQAETP
jgi:hypothetical protein